jgi:hypothetical protein
MRVTQFTKLQRARFVFVLWERPDPATIFFSRVDPGTRETPEGVFPMSTRVIGAAAAALCLCLCGCTTTTTANATKAPAKGDCCAEGSKDGKTCCTDANASGKTCPDAAAKK